MKVIEFGRFGAPHEVCRCIDVDAPGPPGADQLVVEIAACPINPADLLTIAGTYPGPTELPARAGIEGAGRVVALGDDITAFAVGDPVISLVRANWAERVVLKESQAIKLPAGIDMRQAAMLKANPASAHLMLDTYVGLKDGVALKDGDWVIQNAANSAVGRHVIALARARGLHTANVVRRDALVAELLAIGADVVVVDGDDLAERVATASGSAPIALALDAIGGAATMRLAGCLADGGTVVNYGFLAGAPCMIDTHQAIIHGISLTGFWLAPMIGRLPRAEIEAMYGKLAASMVDGTIATPIEASYGLDDVGDALAHAAREHRSGKILLTPNGPIR